MQLGESRISQVHTLALAKLRSSLQGGELDATLL
jgi:DNA-directed RNA polymerase specialized sigma subunit